jgi:hypothetical protein
MSDPSLDLPPLPSSLRKETDASNQLEEEARKSAVKSLSQRDYNSRLKTNGEATGLTPGPIGTPFHVSSPDKYSESHASTPLHFKSTPLREDISMILSVSQQETGRKSVKDTLGRVLDTGYDIQEEDGAFAPKLTLEGYLTSPHINVLKNMNNKELSKVKNFTIIRPGYGKIEWIGETDVRSLNLDEIVKIEKKEVFVYEDCPPVEHGTGLFAWIT